MNTDAEKALKRITGASRHGQRLAREDARGSVTRRNSHVAGRLVYSATDRSFTLLRVADPRSGRAQFAKIRAIRVQLSGLYPCSSVFTRRARARRGRSVVKFFRVFRVFRGSCSVRPRSRSRSRSLLSGNVLLWWREAPDEPGSRGCSRHRTREDARATDRTTHRLPAAGISPPPRAHPLKLRQLQRVRFGPGSRRSFSRLTSRARRAQGPPIFINWSERKWCA